MRARMEVSPERSCERRRLRRSSGNISGRRTGERNDLAFWWNCLFLSYSLSLTLTHSALLSTVTVVFGSRVLVLHRGTIAFPLTLQKVSKVGCSLNGVCVPMSPAVGLPGRCFHLIWPQLERARQKAASQLCDLAAKTRRQIQTSGRDSQKYTQI